MTLEELTLSDFIIRRTYHGEFVVNRGTERRSVYIDAMGAILDQPKFFRHYFERRVGPLTPVGQGNSGALVIGLLGRGFVYDPKPWGLTWSGWRPNFQGPVAIVDDCCFTGKTLDELREACQRQGLIVVKEVVAWPFMDFYETTARRLESNATGSQ